jgi:hypothetical protein
MSQKIGPDKIKNNKSVNAGVKLFVNFSALPTIGLLFDGI